MTQRCSLPNEGGILPRMVRKMKKDEFDFEGEYEWFHRRQRIHWMYLVGL